MEWSWKTLLIFIVIALMIGILIDGFRRMRRNQAAALRLDVKGDLNLTDDDDFNSELPSGGARVVSNARTEPIAEPIAKSTTDSPFYANDDRDDDNRSHYSFTKASNTGHEAPLHEPPLHEPPLNVDDDDRRTHEPLTDTDNVQAADLNHIVDPSNSEKDEAAVVNTNLAGTPPAPVNLDEPAPVLLNVEEMGSRTDNSDSGAEHHVDAVVQDFCASDESVEHSPVNHDSANSTQEDDTDDSKVDEGSDINQNKERDQTSQQPDATPDEPFVKPSTTLEDESSTNDKTTDSSYEPEHKAVKADNVMRPGDHAERLEERESAQEVLVVHVIAQVGAHFSGEDLLYVFNSCDLRLGERDIFHRFEENNGNGRVQFSVSQAYEPGSFDASVLLSQSFSGLSFFMSLPGPKKPLDAYEAMSEMAQFVARNLKGDLLDESHSAMTMQTMEHHREKIMDFERKQRLKGKSK